MPTRARTEPSSYSQPPTPSSVSSATGACLSRASRCKYPSNWPHSPGWTGLPGTQRASLAQAVGNPGRRMEEDVGGGLRGLLPSPSSGGEKGPQSWGLGLPLALGLDLKEKRLIRRREKLPAFFRTLGVAVVLERSSCDWLKPASFCRGLRRKISLVPLRRKLTVGEEGRLRQREGHGRRGVRWGAEKGPSMEESKIQNRTSSFA